VVRGRPDDQHVPAVGDQTQEPDGDAGSAAARSEGDRRQHVVLQQDVRAASQAKHSPDYLEPRHYHSFTPPLVTAAWPSRFIGNSTTVKTS